MFPGARNTRVTGRVRARHATASPAMPTVFDIVTHGSDCLLVNRSTGEQFMIEGVSCVAVEG